MSITLSIPPAIVEEIRDWAAEHGTSLNQYVRECLENKVREIQAARKSTADRFMELCEKHAVQVPPGWKFARAALYEERFEGRFK